MRYVIFDESGNIDGFYSDEANPIIPETAVPITDEQWQEYSAEPHMFVRNDNEGDPARRKTQQERDDEIAARAPAPKTSEQQQIELMQKALDDLILGGAI